MSVDFVCLREAVRTLGIHWKRSRIKIRSLRSKTSRWRPVWGCLEESLLHPVFRCVAPTEAARERRGRRRRSGQVNEPVRCALCSSLAASLPGSSYMSARACECACARERVCMCEGEGEFPEDAFRELPRRGEGGKRREGGREGESEQVPIKRETVLAPTVFTARACVCVLACVRADPSLPPLPDSGFLP